MRRPLHEECLNPIYDISVPVHFFSTNKHPLHLSNFSNFRLQAEAGLWADNKYLEFSYSCPKFAPFPYSISFLFVSWSCPRSVSFSRCVWNQRLFPSAFRVQWHCNCRTLLWHDIRRKRPGLLHQGVVILHDNTGPHTPNRDCDRWRR
jgi:hypothetical protein